VNTIEAAADRTTPGDALALLDPFATRILPGIVRRIAGWKRLPIGELPDLIAELRQELAVDCLQYGGLLAGLPPAERHGRWIRLAERWVYRYRCGICPRRSQPIEDDLPAPELPAEGPAVRLRLDDLSLLANGRCNVTATAARTGRKRVALRAELEATARALGYDDTWLAFWCARAAEALTGLAADLLRDREQVLLVPRARPMPAPDVRLLRIRRLGGRFQVRPGTIEVRRLLKRWRRSAQLDTVSPRILLEDATALAPWQAGAWLWLFEACLVAADPRGAALALRRGRSTAAADRGATLLARARLLEARDRWPAAVALLRRGARRLPQHDGVRRALAALPVPASR
jgi:hypothetical protein